MNQFNIDGIIGKMTRQDNALFVRLVHKDGFRNKKTNQWEQTEDWFTIGFFGKKADSLERNAEVGDRLFAYGSLHVFPKEGPTSRVCLNAQGFLLIQPFSHLRSSDAPDLSQKLEGAYDDDESS